MVVLGGIVGAWTGRKLIPFKLSLLVLPVAMLVALYFVFSFLVVLFLLFAGAAAPTAPAIDDALSAISSWLWIAVFAGALLIAVLRKAKRQNLEGKS